MLQNQNNMRQITWSGRDSEAGQTHHLRVTREQHSLKYGHLQQTRRTKLAFFWLKMGHTHASNSREQEEWGLSIGSGYRWCPQGRQEEQRSCPSKRLGWHTHTGPVAVQMYGFFQMLAVTCFGKHERPFTVAKACYKVQYCPRTFHRVGTQKNLLRVGVQTRRLIF